MKPLVTLELGAQEEERDSAFAEIMEDPSLPRVLLIGDSISIGYTLPVRENLLGKANVLRIPTNGGPTANGLDHLEEWLKDSEWDVIHFNFGLHDIRIMEDGKHQVSLHDYETNLRKIVEKLKRTGARLIWASTTPVPEGNPRPLRHPGDEETYNQAAQRIMQEYEVAVNDLYTYAKKRQDEIQIPENVHFTNEGNLVLAEAVSQAIETSLSAD